MHPSLRSICYLAIFTCSAHAQPVDWVTRGEGADISLRGIAVRDGQHAWASGNEGTVIRTKDAGASWHRSVPDNAKALDFRDIALPEKDVILLLSAGPGDKSNVFRSSDDGATWSVTLANQDPSGFFNAMTFADAHHGFLVGDPIEGRLDFYHTTDGGVTWHRKKGPEVREGEYGFAASGTNLVAVDSKTLFIATGGSTARVFRSSDGGQSWKPSDTPMADGNESSGIFSIDFRSPLNGVIVGGDYKNPDVDKGNAAWTEDGGVTWHLARIAGDVGGKIPHKACVRHLGGLCWLAVGRTGVLLSEDDGKTWTPKSDDSFYAFDIDPQATGGRCVGANGHIGRFSLPAVDFAK